MPPFFLKKSLDPALLTLFSGCHVTYFHNNKGTSHTVLCLLECNITSMTPQLPIRYRHIICRSYDMFMSIGLVTQKIQLQRRYQVDNYHY